MPIECHYAREQVHTSLLYLGNGWTDCAQICYVSRDRYDMWLRQRNWGVSARAHVHTPPLFRVLAWIRWFKVDDCGISRGNFQPTWHVQVTLRHLSCARSFIAHKALYWLHIITSERAQRAERVLSNLREKSEYSRPDPARPGPITLFKSLYLRNCMSDRQAVFFDEYHLDVKVI